MTHQYDEDAEEASQQRWTRGWIVLVSVVLAITCGIVLPPLVNANHFRARLAGDLSAALGRPVQMENVRLRLLPRPGFDFENFEVAGEPPFGAEPVMRAAKVTVGIRLLPLWRGRVEVATVSLTDASLNLARNAAGAWNFSSLLERTAQLPAQLPTAKRRSNAGARFPYFEVTNGRINFKRGEEKLPFSLNDAEFSLWLANPGEWQLRFRATPVRTDLDAAYTGDLRLAGSVRRTSGGLSNAPIALEGSWRHAPLGQMGRVLTSQDHGWRGDASVDFTLTGTPTAANAQAHVVLDGLRREDFVPVANLPVQAHCTAALALPAQLVQSAACAVPAGAGRLLLSANSMLLQRDAQSISSSFGVKLDRVPAEWLLSAMRLVRQGLSPDLHVAGEVTGNFTYAAAAQKHLSGHASWDQGTITTPGTDAGPLRLPDVTVDAGDATCKPPPRKPMQHSSARTAARTAVLTPSLELQPFSLDLGGDTPLQISGTMTRREYDLTLNGSAQLQQVAPLLRALGFARWAVLHRVTGTAQANVAIHDFWMRNPATPPPVVQGAATLRNVTADTAWLPGTIRLAQGKVSLNPKLIAWQGLQWTWAGAKFTGAATRTSLCEDAADCGWRITAHTPTLDLQQLVNVFRPSATDELVQFFRGAGSGGWPPFQIDLSADSLVLNRLNVAHFAAGLTAANAGVKITRGSGVALGSEMECSGSMALDKGTGQLSVAISRASLAAAGALFKENWGSGTAETSMELNMRRGNAPTGTFTAMLHDAALAGAASSSPLAHVQSWQMSGLVLSDHLQLDRSLLTSAGRDYPVTGTIGFDRHFSFDFSSHGGATQHITGNLAATPLTAATARE